jgi:Rrf2 family protein
VRLAAKTEYALKTLIELGLREPGVAVRVAEIAQKHGIPRDFLEQILLALRNSGIVESQRGVQGGYRLTPDAAGVSLAAILGAVGDPICHSRDGRGDGAAPREAVERVIAGVFRGLNNDLRSRLDAVSLGDLCDQARRQVDCAGVNYTI